MPFIPHVDDDVRAMLDTIGVESIDQLFDEIPAELRIGELKELGRGLTEIEVAELMKQRAQQDPSCINFVGAGAYQHFVPAAVWDIVGRGEFYSAYTPYQAEASQGTLQTLFEYQSMICALTGTEASNASLYDGATALAESILMAVRMGRGKSKRILVPSAINPRYLEVVKTLSEFQGIETESIGFDSKSGLCTVERQSDEPATALVIAQPNFFGCLDDVDALTDWAHAQGLYVIALVNPTSLALLKPPGQWGEKGADIVCGEGQPLGVPLSAGGPYFGFMCTRKAFVRQMPGRIVGRTDDVRGGQGYVLTLQAREQHIRRSRATSNICTNQGLLVTAATIYMALMGDSGLRTVAKQCMTRASSLRSALQTVPGVSIIFDSPFFNEFVIGFRQPVAAIKASLEARGILGGYDLSQEFPELGQALLVCATEVNSEEQIDLYRQALTDSLAQDQVA